MGCSLEELVPLASKGSVESLCEGGGVQRSRILHAESNIGLKAPPFFFLRGIASP